MNGPFDNVSSDSRRVNATREWGIVSNCWKQQLDEGQSLDSLIDEAARRGFHAIELRQGCLGEYEPTLKHALTSADAMRRLASLSKRFPQLRFNLAVSLPCFGASLSADDPRFHAALTGAIALSDGNRPHLRLVDTETRIPQMDIPSMESSAELLVDMTRSLISHNGQLSIEHAYQEWRAFWSVIDRARQKLGDDALRLRCCFDPCNLLLTEQVATVSDIVERITPGDVSMIHLKQRHHGQIQPEVSAGDLDWRRLLAALDHRRHQGPWLFEVAPDNNVWDNLQRSIEYLN